MAGGEVRCFIYISNSSLIDLDRFAQLVDDASEVDLETQMLRTLPEDNNALLLF